MADPTKTTSPSSAPSKASAATAAPADAETKLDADDKAREEANIKAGEAAAKVKPTPSQREADLAALGQFNHDDREPSGAPPDPHALQAKKK